MARKKVTVKGYNWQKQEINVFQQNFYYAKNFLNEEDDKIIDTKQLRA